ncbi:hypothetical protein [Eudoraea chungangensis]|uniref:hypothetical protein n=1 Tax=Eudoraea chungangensis TaxID=1481905 RepID=UPI0023EC03BD|nr:hypothetical protein [Eudoraea chungangensis]
MKAVVILFVAVLMLAKPLWPIAEYITNYDYIVTVLCENRDNPQLQCNGKCYLSKQFTKESKENKKNPFGEKQVNEIQQLLFLEDSKPIDLNLLRSIDLKHTNWENFHFLSRLVCSDISEPPEGIG